MIVREALRSLKNSFSKAVFYWLTFVLTSMFIFLFFNISMGDTVGVHWINNDNGTATTVTVFVITVCMIILFFANDFYVRNKSKDLAVRLVCGATYMQLASYLLIQTILILLASIPLGIVLALIMIPVMNNVITLILNEPFVIAIHGNAVFVTSLILVAVVFWTTYLNLAFAYRNSAGSMLNARRMTNPLSGVVFYKNKKKQTLGLWKKAFWVALFVLPLIFFFIAENLTIVLAAMGMFGLTMMIRNVLIPGITEYISEKKADEPDAVASLGFIRTDLVIMKNNLVLLIVSAILLISIVMTPDLSPAEVMLSLLSYVVMNILLSLALMFKYSTELSERKGYFLTLGQIGYTEEQQSKIIFHEVTGFYGFVLFTALAYLESILISRSMHGFLDSSLVLPLTVFLVLPLVICYFLTLYYYRSTVFHHTDKRMYSE